MNVNVYLDKGTNLFKKNINLYDFMVSLYSPDYFKMSFDNFICAYYYPLMWDMEKRDRANLFSFVIKIAKSN